MFHLYRRGLAALAILCLGLAALLHAQQTTVERITLSQALSRALTRSPDLDVLLNRAEAVATQLRAVPGAADVAVEQVAGLSVLTVAPQRTLLARYGLNVGDLQAAVSAALGGRGIGLIYEGDARYPLVMRLFEDLRTDPRALERLPLARPGGGMCRWRKSLSVAADRKLTHF